MMFIWVTQMYIFLMKSYIGNRDNLLPIFNYLYFRQEITFLKLNLLMVSVIH